MIYGQDLHEGLPDEEAHPKCLQTAFSQKAERPAEKLPFGAERGGKSEKERELKHQRDGDVKHGEERKLQDCLWEGRPIQGGELVVFVRRERAG